MDFVAADRGSYRTGGNLPVVRVVLHATQSPEGTAGAEANARYFSRPHGKATSAHYVVDADSVVQCVRESDVAFHAPPNGHSVGVEIVGMSEQSAADWADPVSTATLARAAALVADICARNSVPPYFVDAARLRAGASGVTTHAQVSLAFHQTNHTDPGVGFPIDQFMAMVRGGQPTQPPINNPPSVVVAHGANGPVIDIPEVNVKSQLVAVSVGPDGCGWGRVPAVGAVATWVSPQGPYPPVDGYWLKGERIASQVRDLDDGRCVVVTVQGAVPNSVVSVPTFWA